MSGLVLGNSNYLLPNPLSLIAIWNVLGVIE
jgi:hypothetical protein